MKETGKLKVITTSDGSSTLELPGGNETYHSRHGAVQESMHVFINNGLKLLGDVDTARVFEMGFGTGLNALLTSEQALRSDLDIHYRTIEAFPLTKEQWELLDFDQVSGKDKLRALHEAEWGREISLNDKFTLYKEESKLDTWTYEEDFKVDLVFYDAFGPRTQPELWDIPALKKMYDILRPGGIFVTYCAQGQFKRNLKSLGFKVEAKPGPPGKREMTVAFRK